MRKKCKMMCPTCGQRTRFFYAFSLTELSRCYPQDLVYYRCRNCGSVYDVRDLRTSERLPGVKPLENV